LKHSSYEKPPKDSLRFLKLRPFGEVLSRISSQFATYTPKIESIRVDLALGTVSAEEVKSNIEIPSRTITAMDGYAVRSAELRSASVTKPSYFIVKGSIFVEHGSKLPTLHPGEAYYVATGAPLPKGTDVVVRVEEAVQDGNKAIMVKHVIPKGKDIAEKGEDIQKGQIVVRKGRVLTPTDVTLLIGVGKRRIRAYKIPNVGLLSIGNELKEFDPSGSTERSDGRTTNNYLNLLSGYLEQMGSNSISLGISGDDPKEIQRTILRGLKVCDMILTISGSSVGRHDNVLDSLKRIDGSKVLFHGMRVVPIKPAGVVMVRGKPVIIVPGHAVSSLLTFFTTALPILNALSGLPLQARKIIIGAEAKEDIVNERPIDALCLVRLEFIADSGKYVAIPLDWGSNLVSNLAKADGFVWLSKNQTIPKNETALVQLFTGNTIAK
jgi:molybdopterin biosynthesis enzyme